MKAKEFDKKFDEGKEDIIDDLDLSTARRANQQQKRINVDFPSWVVESLDREAARIGVTRQSIIKVWLVERLQAEAANKSLENDYKAAEETRFLEAVAQGLLEVRENNTMPFEEGRAVLGISNSYTQKPGSNSSVHEKSASLVTAVRCTDDALLVSLADGRTLSVPLNWFPRLAAATPSQREEFQLIAAGQGIHWPSLDEDISVAGLLRGVAVP